MATRLEDMRVARTVISATLNHVSAKASSVTTRHYMHADLSAEVRTFLTRWQATLEHVLTGADPFTAKAGDIDVLEARGLATGFGRPAHSRVAR